jgi:hypothetical protein
VSPLGRFLSYIRRNREKKVAGRRRYIRCAGSHNASLVEYDAALRNLGIIDVLTAALVHRRIDKVLAKDGGDPFALSVVELSRIWGLPAETKP